MSRPRAFSGTLPDLQNLFETYENQSVRTHLSDFSAFQVGLPESWDFQLYGATGKQKVKDVNETGNQVSVQWNESIAITFILYIPANTEPGTYSGIVTIMIR